MINHSDLDQLISASCVRLTVNISAETAIALQKIAAREHISVTEALRRLVSYGDLLYQSSKVEEKTVIFQKEDVRQEVVIP